MQAMIRWFVERPLVINMIMALVFIVRQVVPPRDQQWLYESQFMPGIDVLMDWTQQQFDRFKPDSWSGINV